MAFEETQFPTGLSYNSSFGPGFNTAIVTTDGGQEQRTARWQNPRRQYDVSYAIRTIADLNDVIRFYTAMRGQLTGFRFKDWSDFTSSSTGVGAETSGDQLIGTGDGSTTTFQLVKLYTQGTITHTRKINKPVSGTVLINTSIGSPTWSVDTATGIVTFDTAPSDGATITAGYEFDVPVRFGQLPQEVLSLNYEFFDGGSIPSIPLIEILDPEGVNGQHPFGGAAEFDFNAEDGNISISPGTGRVVYVETDEADRKIFLPNPGGSPGYPPGCPYFNIVNSLNSTHPVLVRDSADSGTIVEVGVGQAATIGLTQNDAGTKFWYGF